MCFVKFSLKRGIINKDSYLCYANVFSGLLSNPIVTHIFNLETSITHLSENESLNQNQNKKHTIVSMWLKK